MSFGLFRGFFSHQDQFTKLKENGEVVIELIAFLSNRVDRGFFAA